LSFAFSRGYLQQEEEKAMNNRKPGPGRPALFEGEYVKKRTFTLNSALDKRLRKFQVANKMHFSEAVRFLTERALDSEEALQREEE
jgi:nickel-dependent lactate racemase